MSAGRETQGRSLSQQAPTGVGGISLGLALVAIFTVLAFGGRYSLAIFIMQTSICALSIFTLWRFGWPAVPRAALAVLGILLAIPLVQMLPLWEEIVAALSPARVAIAREVLSPVVGPSKVLTLSVNPHATSAATLNLVCYGLVFLLAFHVCIHRRQQPALFLPSGVRLAKKKRSWPQTCGLCNLVARLHSLLRRPLANCRSIPRAGAGFSTLLPDPEHGLTSRRSTCTI